MTETPKYPEDAVAVAMFIGSDQWYELVEFVDPAACGRRGDRPPGAEGWAEARAGRDLVWIDLAMAYKIFVYSPRAQEERHRASIELWNRRV